MRSSVFLCAVFGLALSPVALAVANELEKTTEQPAADAPVERVAVTGSRLKGVDMEGANPLQSFTQDDITKRGYESVSEFLRDLPQASSAGTFSETGGVGGADGAPAGASGVSLRGLGSSSTLVLVNGRRVAVDSFSNGSDSFVNVNSIPLSAIKRIDVLTDGASSIYGSDAIAGVINFILRKDFVGHELSAQYGDDTSAHDASRKNLTYAGGFATENSNTTVVVDYATRNAIFNSDRPVNVTFESSTRMTIDGEDYAESWCGDDTQKSGTRCNYDYVIQRAIQPDFENIGTTFNHIYRLDNGLEFFAEGMYQKNTGSAYEAPAGYTVDVAGDSANIPQYVHDIDMLDGSVSDVITVRTRFPERRVQEYDTQSYRVLAGLRGELADWSWETAASYGKSTNEITNVAGYMNATKLDAAVAADEFNPFNLGRDSSAAQIATLRDPGIRKGESEVLSLDFNISGDLFALPAGTVSSVFGGELRKEQIFDRPSINAVNNEIIGLGASDAEADRTQYAVYGEFNFPITDTLDVIAALRYDHYSDFGGDVNPKISMRYRPLEDLVLRASWSTGFRAPSLSQLGAGTSLSSQYINCGSAEPYNALCGTAGAEFGELEFDQETIGNKDLSAEKSAAINVGVSWNLTEALQLTVDYWRYEHDDIVDIDANTTLDACIKDSTKIVTSVAELGDEFGCVVDGQGDISFLRTGYFNVGNQNTDGIDYKLDYRLDTETAGEFKFYVAGTETLSFERQVTPSTPVEDLLGRLSGASEIARPESVLDLGTDWQLNDWSASLSGHYISSLGDGDFKFDNETVDSWLTFSASLGYELNEHHSFLVSVRNLTDEEPPYASSPTNGYASSVHDWLGRRWNVRYTFKF
ncbi:TonB-dependent receptor [Shewanella sp. SP2S2-6]|uniref:TonB-dependent receptor n=1 Tax=Shewanella sp. SP2S2-6 TaxID=3063540 RepID=UPI00288E3D21|nr:TonB-dependent receptor [Shewanella sp. SP2S2-6]MDT3297323.1 TonB-dependent receptor [Shewanella sp. SP2S2-6]